MIRTVPINIKARFVSFKIRKHTPRAYDGRYGKTLQGRGGKAVTRPVRKSSRGAGAEKQPRGRGGKAVTRPMWKSNRGAGAAGHLRQDGACDRFFLSSLKMQHHGGVALEN